MAITDYEKQKIQDWLIKNNRECPICSAGAEKLLPVDIFEAVPPEAATERGIDTSIDIHNAKIVCQNKDCGFEAVFINLEDAGLY